MIRKVCKSATALQVLVISSCVNTSNIRSIPFLVRPLNHDNFIIRSRKTWLVGNVADIREMRNVQSFSWKTWIEETTLNIYVYADGRIILKRNLRKIKCEVMAWNWLGQDMAKSQALVFMVMTLPGPKNWGISWLFDWLPPSQEWLCSLGAYQSEGMHAGGCKRPWTPKIMDESIVKLYVV
jgi:hypothetical protein